MFHTSSQSFQRQDDQEVHAISCFLSKADEMQYICAHDQPVRDACRIIFVPITSTKEQRSLTWEAFASAAELCPENYGTGHKPYNNVWVVECKLHTLLLVEYCYWWMGRLLMKKWTHQVCRLFFKSFSVFDFKVKIKVYMWVLVVSLTFLQAHLGWTRCR